MFHQSVRINATPISMRSVPNRPGLPIIRSLAFVFCMVGYHPAQAADAPSSRSLLEQAEQFEDAQRYDDAITVYRTILQQDPENDEVRATIARLLSWQGAHAESASLYREIMQRHPADLDIPTALARVRSWQIDRKEARTLYEGVLQENPHHAEALQGLGDLLFWEGLAADALPFYEHVYTITHDSAVAERMASIKRAQIPSPTTPPEPPTNDDRTEQLAQAKELEQKGM